MMRQEEALFVIPTNIAAKLYNKDKGTVLIAVLSSGMLQCVTSDHGVTSLEMLDGKKVSIPAPGSSPDVISRFIFKAKKIQPIITYGATPEIAKLLAVGKIKNAILPEPAASSVMFKGKLHIFQVADLRNEWISLFPETNGIPQVCIATHNTFLTKNSELVREFVSILNDAVDWTNVNLKQAGILGKKRVGLGIPEKVITESVSAMNLTCKEATDSRKDIEIYLKALHEMDPKTIGEKLPDSNFYAF
jgi:NitT/TauT family transport system substrate-binding protein